MVAEEVKAMVAEEAKVKAKVTVKAAAMEGTAEQEVVAAAVAQLVLR